jgi:hypothetical protein
MTYPRSQLVPPGAPGVFHCVSRCVRRAFLCGEDSYTGKSFEHRRQWVEDRLREVGEVFSVSIWGYAVMSNHLHVVVQTLQEVAASWRAMSALDVQLGWYRLLRLGYQDFGVQACSASSKNPLTVSCIALRTR